MNDKVIVCWLAALSVVSISTAVTFAILIANCFKGIDESKSFTKHTQNSLRFTSKEFAEDLGMLYKRIYHLEALVLYLNQYVRSIRKSEKTNAAPKERKSKAKTEKPSK